MERGRRIAGRKPDQLFGHHLTIEVNASHPSGTIERQGHVLVVASDENATQTVSGGESAVLEEQRACAAGSHQTQGQIGDAGVFDPDTHLHIGNRPRIIDLNRSHRPGDIN